MSNPSHQVSARISAVCRPGGHRECAGDQRVRVAGLTYGLGWHAPLRLKIKAGRKGPSGKPIRRVVPSVRNAAYAVTFATEGSVGVMAISKQLEDLVLCALDRETCGAVRSS